ncbi:thiamine diphosphokinase [Parapedobacter sp. SGR-10]|uniref:thiamine diphosphokinase n=1 Tax=Parapedobacter sp. SGR-10 TaxID=2710879 RepID=UPI0013D67595|nr:thiamine diphosphokinase [Parapedobacter sp. SGR-10]NGF55314.1 thiamine diphosphokinase [Parapedobacter sp. SGR-10]
MSSHHIVRENQEPALLITSARNLAGELLGQLLEWSPTIITDTQNLDYLLALGIKVDVVFGDVPAVRQDSIQQISIEQGFPEDAMHYLVSKGFKAVNMWSDNIHEDLSSFAGQINIVLFCADRRYVCVKGQFEKWLPKNETVYFDEAYIKSFQGVEYVNKGTFRTVADGFMTLEFSTDSYVWIGEDL